MPGEQKSGGETNTKGYNPGGHLGSNTNAPINMQRLFTEQISKSNEININIQYGIRSSTCQIPESLNRNNFGNRTVEKIDKRYNDMFGL